MPVWPKCTAQSLFPSIQALYIHYKITHDMLNTSPYVCAEENCLFQKSFSSWARMRRHYRTFHKFSSDAAPAHERVRVGHDIVQEIDCLLDAFSAYIFSFATDYLRLKYFENSGNLSYTSN